MEGIMNYPLIGRLNVYSVDIDFYYSRVRLYWFTLVFLLFVVMVYSQ